MKLFAGKPSFTVALVPDSGYDTKTGSMSYRIITTALTVSATVFFLCLLIIIGYHIKLSQERGYSAAVHVMHSHIDTIDRYEASLAELTTRMSGMQNFDRAFRQYAELAIPDDDMYRAGIGGHMLFDDSVLTGFDNNLFVSIRDLLMQLSTLDSKVRLEKSSFYEIRNALNTRKELIDNTPSILPTQSLNVTSGFGTRRNPITGKTEYHDAVDFTAPLGTKIYATADGIVTESQNHSIRGNYVTIKHKYGYTTMYAHLHTILVEVGQNVKKHDIIGTMGKTGRATGVNLHYSITHNNRKVNPLKYF